MSINLQLCTCAQTTQVKLQCYCWCAPCLWNWMGFHTPWAMGVPAKLYWTNRKIDAVSSGHFKTGKKTVRSPSTIFCAGWQNVEFCNFSSPTFFFYVYSQHLWRILNFSKHALEAIEAKIKIWNLRFCFKAPCWLVFRNWIDFSELPLSGSNMQSTVKRLWACASHTEHKSLCGVCMQFW